jgi:chaperonin GroES
MSYDNQEQPSTGAPQSADTRYAKLIDAINIAEKLKEDKLVEIGQECRRGYLLDDNSRQEWLKDTQDWLDLAKQLRDEKTYPWNGASNVKYPLISTAAMQFAARSYPSLVPGDGNLVKTKILGKDRDGQKASKGDRVSKFMSWQLLYQMDRWEEDMDRLLIMLPVWGMMFKKTYFDKTADKPVSELVYPEYFVVDYMTSDLENAERYSEIVFMSPRKLKEKQAAGEYLDIDLGPPPIPTDLPQDFPDGADSIVPYTLIQQATWFDLDDDGIKEPYTVLFHKDSGKVLKITARFLPDDIVVDDKGDVVAINAQCYYTKFGFIPNPDGSFYDLGFGHLLGPLNESVNTLINQLVDSGTLANLQAGFVGKGLRMKMGDSPLRPGEWRAVNAVGDDIRKQMIPLPAKEPSAVLFQLLGMLITSGKELASVAEIFVGKMPGQNTPATTTMASIEQGMKVFTAIYKRIYKALDKEFKKLFYINKEFLDQKTYAVVLDDEAVNPQDFDTELYDICPAADPNASSQQEKLAKAQALVDLLPLGTIDPMQVTIRILQAMDQPNWETLIPGMAETGQPQPQQKPDPKMIEMQMKMQGEQQKSAMKQQEMQQKMAMGQRDAEFKLAMKAQEHQIDMQSKMEQAKVDSQIARDKQQIFMADSMNKLQVNQAMGEQKVQQAKEMAKSKPQSKSGSTGKTISSPKQSKGNSKKG